MKKKLSHLLILSAVGFTTLATPVLSVEASYEEGIQETSQRLNQLKKEEQNAQKQLSMVTSKISETEKQSEKLVAEIKATTKLLDELKVEIEELNTAIEARELKLTQQARAVQVSGEASNMVGFVLQAESLGDVIGRLDVVSHLVGANKNLVVQQQEDKAAVELKETETKENQEKQMVLAAELESKKAELEVQQVEKEALVASIAAERSGVQSERAQYLAQKADAERRASDLTNAQSVASQTSSRTSETDNSPNRKPVASKPTNTPAQTISGGSVVSNAHALSGVRYSWGGRTPSGFDCSGFTSYVYRKAGKSISRTASGQYASTTRISQSQAKPGDLIFFNQTGRVDHVGIYLGGGRFIGAQTSTGVAVASFTSGYWARYVVGFGRVN